MTSNLGFSIKAAAWAAFIGLLLWAPATLGQVLEGAATTFAGPDDYTPGAASETYTLTITNTSTDTNAVDVVVDFSLPTGATISSVSCTTTGTGSSCNVPSDGDLVSTANQIAENDGAIAYSLVLDFASDMSAASIDVSAAISATDITPFTETASSNLLRVSDLSVTKTGPDAPAEYVPGTEVTYQIVVTNDGPSDATGVGLQDAQPTGVSYVWTCAPTGDCPANSGTGGIDQPNLAIAAGGSLTYTVTATTLSSLETSPLVNTAIITVPAALNDPDSTDPNAVHQESSSVSLVRRAETDLSTIFAAGQPDGPFIAGSANPLNFEIEVSNAGPTDSPESIFSLTANPSVASFVLTCLPETACSDVLDADTNPVSGAKNIALAKDDAVTVTAAVTFASSTRENVVLTAAIAPSDESDTNNNNNQDSLTLTVARQADIQVTKAATTADSVEIASINPGAGFQYEIIVENLGPSDVGPGATLSAERGILLNDTFPTGLLGRLDCSNSSLPCWSACVDDLGQAGAYTPANCPGTVISGSGDLIDVAFSLAAGSSSKVIAKVRPPDSATGDLVNTATAVLDPTSPVLENTPGGGEASDTAITELVFSADVAVTKTDDTETAVAGAIHSYTVTVRNLGFLQVNNVEITDEFPRFKPEEFPELADNAGFIAGQISWQCRAFGGACCNSGSGSCGDSAPTVPVTSDRLQRADGLPVAVDLRGGSRVEFTITGPIDPRSSGTLVNEAIAIVPDEVTDPNPGNQSDRDETSIVRQASLLVEKSLAGPPVGTGPNSDLPPFTLVYDIRVESLGPSFIESATISDPLDDANFDLTTLAPSWTCSEAPGSGSSACPAESGTGALNNEEFAIAPGGVLNFKVTAQTTDLAAGEITNTVSVDLGTGAPPFTASTTTSLIGQARLEITKTDNRGTLAPGSEIEYVIRVQNHGPDDVFGATVEDIFPDTIDGVAWMCDAATPIPGDIAPASFTATPADTGGDAVAVSPDGRHVYVVGKEADSLFVYDRNNVPGTRFGEVVLLATEINGFSSSGDLGGTVNGMESPFDVVITPDGFTVYVLSASEPEAKPGFVEQFSQGRWTPITQNFGCGSSTVAASSTEVSLTTATGCASIFAGYNHTGAEQAGTVSFRWQVTNSAAHNYVARYGIQGQPLTQLSSGQPGTGTGTVRVEVGDQLVFNIAKSASGVFQNSTLTIDEFEFTPDEDQPPTLAAFGRKADPADPDFGRLVYLDTLNAGLPTRPTALAATNDSVYVAGRGDPDGSAGNTAEQIVMYRRNAQTGLLTVDHSLSAGVPADPRSLAVDAGGGWLLAGGESLGLYAIEPAVGTDPPGLLTLADTLDIGAPAAVALDLALAEGAPSAYARTSDGRLLWLSYLDQDENGLLAQRGVYTAGAGANGLGLPTGDDSFLGIGDIAVAADGEHLAGVSREAGLIYILRRDLVSGGLGLQESRVFDPVSGSDRGLAGASAVRFSPDGRHLLIAAAADQVSTNPPLSVLTRRAPDPLFAFLEVERQNQDGVTGLLSPTDVAVSPDGAHVYTVSLADNALVRFNRFPRLGLDDESQGQHLQFERRWTNGEDGINGLQAPRRILISPNGLSVFVTSQDQDRLLVFRRIANPDATDFGNLEFVGSFEDGQGGVSGLSGAQGMAMDPGSQHLYVAGRFANAIARFRRHSDGSLGFVETIANGVNGVVGLGGIVDLAVSFDGRQLLGVGNTPQSSAVVVFDREFDSGSDDFGQLSFVQRLNTGIGQNPVALAISPEVETGGEHVYVVAPNSNSLAVLRRVTDTASSAFGQIQPLAVLTNGSDGISFMNRPRDVSVSPDGRRIYVAAESSNSVLVFDRDLNTDSGRFGLPTLREVRRQSVRGVDGLAEVRALAVSNDSRHVYAAGFASQALAAFRLGTGSVCSAGGSGNISERVDIGANGTLVFRATGVVRPSATERLTNTATLTVPENFVPLTLTETGCPGDSDTCNVPLPRPTDCPGGADYCATDETILEPAGELQISKVAAQVSVTAGERARYTVTITNSGPSSLVHEPPSPPDDPGAALTLSDRLDAILDSEGNPAFVPGSGAWTCEAIGSGGLDLVDFWAGEDVDGAGLPSFDGLAGVSGLALVPETRWLVATSIIDNAISVFARDAASGALLSRAIVRAGDDLGGGPMTSLDGAQGVAVSADGQYVYIASRISDAITVLSLSADGSGSPVLGEIQVIDERIGLDQAQHLALSPDQRNLYVAAANDDTISVWKRDPDTGRLTEDPAEVQLVREGIGGVSGLNSVAHVLVSSDGNQVYALSPTQGTITWFDRDTDTGQLTWRRTYGQVDFGVGLKGAGWAVSDADSRFIYVAARDADRIIVLERDRSATGSQGQLSFSSSIGQADLAGSGLAGISRLALSADQAHVYASSAASGTVAWFVRDAADGSLRYAGVRGSSAGGLSGATGLVIDNQLDQLFVAGTAAGAISQFQRQADSFCEASGTGQIENEPFRIGAGGRVVFSIEAEVAGGASGTIENEAVLDAARNLSGPQQSASQTNPVAREADLFITKDDGISEIDGLAGAAAVAGTQEHFYVAAPDDNAIGVFARVDGLLTFVEALRSGVGAVDGVNGVSDVLVSADGAHVYSASPVDNAVAVFERAASSGRLNFLERRQNGVGGVSGLSGATGLAVSPDGEHLYVAGRFDNSLAVFARQTDATAADFGRLSFLAQNQNGVGGVTGLSGPVALTVSGDGLHVYAVGNDSNSVAVFRRNRTAASPAFGELTFVAQYSEADSGITGLQGARDLVLSADGTRLYVLGEADGTLVRFERNPETGVLDFLGFSRDGDADVTGLTGARSLLLDDVGRRLYVAGAQAGVIVSLIVDPDGGPLQFEGVIANGDPAPLTGGEVFGLDGVAGLFLSPNGDHLYAASSERNALLGFSRAQPEMDLAFQQILIDGLGGVAPGERVEYLITVGNNGPSNVEQARVIDLFPDAFQEIAWECSPVQGSGAECPRNGSGNLDIIVRLPVDGQLLIRASGEVAAGATGRLSNTATVTAIGVTDLNPDNNTATDDDTVLSPAMDVFVAIDGGTEPFVPGDTVAWEVSIGNRGPSTATTVLVDDVLPGAAFDVAWQCEAIPAAGLLRDAQNTPLGLPAQRLVIAPDGRFAYAVGGNSIAAFRREPSTGALTLLQTLSNGQTLTNDMGQVIGQVSGLLGASDLTLGGGGRFVYVAGAQSDAIAIFERASDSGQLSFQSVVRDGLNVDGLGGVRRLLLSPEGDQLYAGADGSIVVLAINQTSGGLTLLSRLTQGVDNIDGLSGLTDLAWIDDGDLLAVTALTNESLALFDRTASTGRLQLTNILLNDDLLGGPAAGSLLGASAIQVLEDELLVAARTSNQIGRFQLNRTENELGVTEVGLTPGGRIDAATLGQGLTGPRRLVFDPDQARLYVAVDEGVLMLSLLADHPSVISVDEAPALTGLALGPLRRHLYALAGSEITAWNRERGSRCPLGGVGGLGRQATEISAGGELRYRVASRIRANATGSFDYTVSANTPIAAQEINPADNTATDARELLPASDLAVSKSLETARVVAGLPVAWQLDFTNAGLSDAAGARLLDRVPVFPDPDGGVLAGSGNWTCTANPALGTPEIAAIGSTIRPDRIRMGRAGAFIYGVSAAEDALMLYPIDENGIPEELVFIRNGDSSGEDVTVAGLGGASAVAVSDDELHVYVTGRDDDALVVFTREEVGEPLRFQQRFFTTLSISTESVAGLRGAADVQLSADGRLVFVFGAVSNAIAVFRRDPETGLLTWLNRVFDGQGTIEPEFNVIQGGVRLHPTANGAELYAYAARSQALSRFFVDGTTGVLTFEGVQRTPSLPELAEVRELAGAPGDSHLYLLAPTAILVLALQSDANPVLSQRFDALGDLSQATALVIDPSGSRAYVFDQRNGALAIHVLRRDWADGSLEFWQTIPITGSAPGALTLDAERRQLFAVAEDDQLQRLAELALSRCSTVADLADEIDTRVDLGATGAAEFSLGAIVHPSARGHLVNGVAVEPGVGIDPQLEDNLDVASAEIEVVSDLAVFKTGPAQAVAGEMIRYEIQVTNAGPSDGLGIGFRDPAPAALLDLEWSCSASAGSSCPEAGQGAPDFFANVLVDGQLDLVIDARIDPAFRGQLVNVALLTPEVGAEDPNENDQRAETVTDVIAVAEVALLKTTVGEVVAGTPLRYRLDIFNAGPSDAAAVRVADDLSGLPINAEWTCSGDAGVICPLNAASGSIDQVLYIPAGAQAMFEISGPLPPSSQGVLVNRASASVEAPTTDPDPNNNAAEVEDQVLVRPDVSLTLDARLNAFDPAGTGNLILTAEVSNHGPSLARDLVAEFNWSAAELDVFPLPPGCTVLDDGGLGCVLADLEPGQARTLQWRFAGLPSAPTAFTVFGLATTSGEDPDLSNNEAVIEIELETGVDLDVSMGNGFNGLSLGQTLDYVVTVGNIGSIDASVVDLEVLVPSSLLNPSWRCEASGGATCTATGSGDLVDAVVLPAGATLVYRLTVTVDPDLDPAANPVIEVTVTAATRPPENDINLRNNEALVRDAIIQSIFRDRFETAGAGGTFSGESRNE